MRPGGAVDCEHHQRHRTHFRNSGHRPLAFRAGLPQAARGSSVDPAPTGAYAETVQRPRRFRIARSPYPRHRDLHGPQVRGEGECAMRWAIVMMTTCSLVLGAEVPGWAQDADTRPATTTFLGDTGLWFVPTGEVLPRGAVSLSAHRTELDFRQGNTSVSAWPITGAVGIGL